jgi:hypothetical protein
VARPALPGAHQRDPRGRDGPGKTIQTIALVAWLLEKCNDAGPHLICAPLGTLSNWETEFQDWFPQLKVIKYIGPPNERKELERRFVNRTSNINAILTSYEFVVHDRGVLDYSCIVIDKAHKLKNHQGKLSQTLTHHYTSKNRLLLTATPLQNNPRELWSLLNFILPTNLQGPQQVRRLVHRPLREGRDSHPGRAADCHFAAACGPPSVFVQAPEFRRRRSAARQKAGDDPLRDVRVAALDVPDDGGPLRLHSPRLRLVRVDKVMQCRSPATVRTFSRRATA